MCRCKNGNPKKSSHFICIKHQGENCLGAGIQRGGHQREKWHRKDLYCVKCREVTKNLEVRWCDDYIEAYEIAEKLREEYYPETENNKKVS